MGRVVIQHGEQELFLRADQSWTRCIAEAEPFPDIVAAAAACRERQLTDARVAVHMFGTTTCFGLDQAARGAVDPPPANP